MLHTTFAHLWTLRQKVVVKRGEERRARVKTLNKNYKNVNLNTKRIPYLMRERARFAFYEKKKRIFACGSQGQSIIKRKHDIIVVCGLA